MKRLLLLVFVFPFFLGGYAQKKTPASGTPKVLTGPDAELSLSILDGGKYKLSFQNAMTTQPDFRDIVFRNKKDTKSFISSIGQAIKAIDATSAMIVYSNYRIRLLTETGGVFMVVEEKEKTQATFRITPDHYKQINILN